MEWITKELVLNSVLFLFFSYILGSFPSGYLITRFSTGKNILKIGWRKTSSSNVYRSVGKWQALLTALLDVSKGYLAVFLAQKIGFSSEIQILSGLAAIIGHNWSCFLKFAGGRGIGTFTGALAALSPTILGFFLVPVILLSLIGASAIGTLISLAITIFASVYFNQFWLTGIFTTLCLFPILIKRLSPIKEILPLKENWILIRNRLLFDNNQVVRLGNIFKKWK